MLGWFAEAPDPDAGLLGFRQVSDALGATHWYLGLLRDGGAVAERLATGARVLAGTPPTCCCGPPRRWRCWPTTRELAPRGRAALLAEVLAAAGRNDDPASGGRRRCARSAGASCSGPRSPTCSGRLDVEQVGHALTDVTAADRRRRPGDRDPRRRGGPRRPAADPGRGDRDGPVRRRRGRLRQRRRRPVRARPAAGRRRAGRDRGGARRRRRAAPAAGPAGARPAARGRRRPAARGPATGPLVRTFASYAAYYERWSLVWESQALLRAEPVAGDARPGRALRRARRPAAVPARRPGRRRRARDPPDQGPGRGRADAPRRRPRPAHQARSRRAGRRRVDGPAAPAPPRRRGARRCAPPGRWTRCARPAAAGLLARADAAILEQAWLLATRVRNALVLVRGRPSDTCPADTRELAALAHVLGYAPGRTGQLVEDYLRATRRARAVVERVFYA